MSEPRDSLLGPCDPHHGQPAAAWGSPYTPAKEDWHSYGTTAAPSTASPGQFGFSPPDFNAIQPPGSGLLPPPISSSVPQLSPNAQRRTPYEWMRRSIPSTSNNGKEPSCAFLGAEDPWA
nr:PREDICTED: homeobox protein CDX-1 [Phalacrocorax carbo]